MSAPWSSAAAALLLLTLLATPWCSTAAHLSLGKAFRASGLNEAPLEPWSEVLSDEGAAAHASISRWLHTFFAREPADRLFPSPPRRTQTKPRSATLAPRQQKRHQEDASDRHIWTRWNSSQSCDGLTQALPAVDTRRNLVIAPVGSTFNAST